MFIDTVTKDPEEKLDIRFDSLAAMIGSQHIGNVAGIAGLLFGLIHAEKEKTYKRSFARRGIIGVFMNLARKWDRIETFVKADECGVEMIDALADMAVYAVKWLDIIRTLYPELFALWVERVIYQDLGMTEKEAKEIYEAYMRMSEESCGKVVQEADV